MACLIHTVSSFFLQLYADLSYVMMSDPGAPDIRGLVAALVVISVSSFKPPRQCVKSEDFSVKNFENWEFSPFPPGCHDDMPG